MFGMRADMRRGEFLGVLGGVATLPFAARTQEPGRVYRIGGFVRC
jgi:hypothetical protein